MLKRRPARVKYLDMTRLIDGYKKESNIAKFFRPATHYLLVLLVVLALVLCLRIFAQTTVQNGN